MSEENWADEGQADVEEAPEGAHEETSPEETSPEDSLSEEISADATPVGQEAQSSAAERTGNPSVDEVLASLDTLDGTPVAEQVAVFEAAHEKLRAALADAGNEPPA